jgi:hypothetical protein
MKYLLIIIAVFTFGDAYAQLLHKEPVYPYAKTVKIYNNNGYWRSLTIDSAGRVVTEESYKKNKLLAKLINEYNRHNDKIKTTQTFDINNPDKARTTHYEYKYAGDIITYQKISFENGISTTIQLIERTSDSILVYNVDAIWIYKLTYKNGLLHQLQQSDLKDKSVQTTTYQYFPNGKVKHRLFEQNPPGKFFSPVCRAVMTWVLNIYLIEKVE